MKSVYIIGSLRNPNIVQLGNKLRELGYDVFDDWMAAGPEADDYWQKYETARGRSYAQALKGLSVDHVFQFDKKHLAEADIAILLMPAGKSGHLELGWALGKGKLGYILFDKEPERWDAMYLFASGVFFSEAKLLEFFGIIRS